MEYEEDYEDVTVNQMLAPKSQDSDTTEILNNLLKEYDKKLRPDIGGKAATLCLNPLRENSVRMSPAGDVMSHTHTLEEGRDIWELSQRISALHSVHAALGHLHTVQQGEGSVYSRS